MRAGVSALGEAATVTQQYQMRLADLNLQLAKGEISQETFNQAVRGLDQERHLQGLRASVGALGSAATETERYALRLAELQQKLATGQISQEQFNRALAGLNPFIGEAQRALEHGISGFVEDLAKGVELSKALVSNLQNVGNALIEAGSKQIASQAVSGLGSMLGGAFGGFGGGIAAIGIGVGIQALTKLFGDNDEAAKQAANALAQAQQAWAGMQRQVESFLNVARGVEQGALGSKLLEMYRQVHELTLAAWNAKQMDKFVELWGAWHQLLARTNEEFVFGTPKLGEWQAAMKKAHEEAVAYKNALISVGVAARRQPPSWSRASPACRRKSWRPPPTSSVVSGAR